MLKTIRIILFICILSLVFISVAAHFNWIPEEMGRIIKDNFGLYTGLASIIGLFAFAVPTKIRSTDFESEELQKLKSLLQTTEELKKIEENKNKTAQELLNLEQQKKVMEISIQRAGLALFYKDQLKRSTETVLERLRDDKLLNSSISMARDSMKRLKALDEEIETDENVELIKDILMLQSHAEKPKPTISSPTDVIFESAYKAITKIIGI